MCYALDRLPRKFLTEAMLDTIIIILIDLLLCKSHFECEHLHNYEVYFFTIAFAITKVFLHFN